MQIRHLKKDILQTEPPIVNRSTSEPPNMSGRPSVTRHDMQACPKNKSEMRFSVDFIRPLTLSSKLVSVFVCTVPSDVALQVHVLSTQCICMYHLTWHYKYKQVHILPTQCICVSRTALRRNSIKWFVFIMRPRWFTVRWQQNVLDEFTKLKKRLLPSSWMSVRPSFRPSARPPAWDDSVPTGRIFTKFGFCVFFKQSVDEIQVSLKYKKNNWYFT